MGGLTDGLLACSYVESLATELDRRGWALVQPVLSSSYAQYGTSSLQRDADELAELLMHLERTRPSVQSFAIVGHSTGCQDAVTLLERAPPSVRRRLRAAILQAPVSDREAASLEGDEAASAALLRTAESMVSAGAGDKLIPDFLHYGFVPSVWRDGPPPPPSRPVLARVSLTRGRSRPAVWQHDGRPIRLPVWARWARRHVLVRSL